MWNNVVLVLGCFLTGSVLGQWTCTQDSQCADVVGGVCVEGACTCPAGQQLGGPRCVDLAPYHTSVCVADFQCSRLFASFECRAEEDTQEGECRCQDGFHYFLGRCWRTTGYGASCTQDEECLDVPRDPYSLRCDGTCMCSQGYYERQRGECRKIGYAVGDGCVLDEDCQFANGVCNIETRTCALSTTRISSNTTAEVTPLVTTFSSRANVTSSVLTSARTTRQHGTACSFSVACDAPFECSPFGACICPVGYYASENGLSCLAELGSVSTAEQCVGLLAEVIGGVCSCPPNFFYENNMRDCVKVTRRITDSCMTDANCHTFGVAAVCGEPEQWGLRTCICDTEQSVWDAGRQMCRLFAGVGEPCEVDNDCLAGELEIQCVADETGQGYCECPEGFFSVDGLCLTTGLSIGDACQASQECTETLNTECINGNCTCGNGYQLVGEDFCAPIIGGTCALDDDCVIEDTVCYNNSNVLTCQCKESFIAHNDTCWPVSLGYEEECHNTVQCSAVMGEHGVCVNGQCVCEELYHFRDGNCWPVTGLFEGCSRTSQCYLSTISDRVVCRNGLCQCDFDHPYSEAEQTCMSSATSIFGSTVIIMAALMYLVVS